MATFRSRVKDEREAVAGEAYWSITQTSYPRSSQSGKYQECLDYIGNRTGANRFDLTTKRYGVATVNGRAGGEGSSEVRNYPILPSQPAPVPGYGLTGVDQTTLSDLSWEILARTNPNVPHVSVPTMVAETRDLPLLIKKRGDDLLSKVASGFVSWRFAVKPMMSDMRKLFDFQDAVAQRLGYLNRLASGKDMRRRCSLGYHAREEVSSTKVFNSFVASVSGRTVTKYTRKLWGTVSYSAAPTAKIPESLAERRNLAWRMAAGVTSHSALRTMWELAPWSWFVDWFYHFGTLIDAIDNTIPLVPRRMCVMQYSTARRVYVITKVSDWATLSGTQFEDSERKERFPTTPVLPFYFSIPAVTAGQWSILGALGVLKAKRLR